MTKSTWAVIIIVVLLLAVGAAVAYREPLSRLFSRPQAQAPVLESPGTGVQMQQYATTTFALQYPPEYALGEAYAYDQFGPKKLIHGVSLAIPAAMATASTSSPQAGTNLSAGTYLSIEQLPRAKKCTGDIFISADVKTQTVTEGGIDYSLATTSGAAAGNRYEELVYALATSSPCTAVRYYIHSSGIENFVEGAVQEFDKEALLTSFDKIRQSLVLQ